jgi:hypothetical protein
VPGVVRNTETKKKQYGETHMVKASRGGRMTAAKKRAAKTAGGKGPVKARPAGKRIMRT